MKMDIGMAAQFDAPNDVRISPRNIRPIQYYSLEEIEKSSNRIFRYAGMLCSILDIKTKWLTFPRHSNKTLC